ncbi:hypothetical protein OB236_22990 [Paenibacillus sp. WQ 127069]|uniref:Uncharacterized protein n=1 Tax=Paenibacillus baimaensis TaxID=2982185 RepID=A0ABT2UK32_9BACL|nr:hypothetical protein [Paenibacillus sp. WQ 127069]
MIRIDLKNDGYTSGSDDIEPTEQQQEEHRQKIQKYVTDPNKGAFIAEDSVLSMPIGMIHGKRYIMN